MRRRYPSYTVALPEVMGKLVTTRHYDRKRYPFCWNVKMYKAHSFDAVFQKMGQTFYLNAAEAVTMIPSMDDLRFEWEHGLQHWYDAALDTMQTNATDSETYKYVTPKLAKLWGLGEDSGPWDTGFEFQGRSSGWLCLTKFLGDRLDGFDLFQPEQYSELFNQRLCCMLEEVTQAVARREEEMLYQLAFQMKHNMPTVVPSE